MKKQATRKLGLARETLAPLQSDVLLAIAGGKAITVTLSGCPSFIPGGLTCLLCMPGGR
jgi:hypothetical protein